MKCFITLFIQQQIKIIHILKTGLVYQLIQWMKKKIYDEQKICNVAVVNTEWERYRGKNYKNLVINEGNVTKYFNCVPGYKIVTLLNACEYERIIYGISGIYDILAPKRNHFIKR